MQSFFPRDKIEVIGTIESKIGCSADFALNVIIDNQANIFIFITADII